MAERIKVIFKRVYVKNDADTCGSGEFYFVAHVDRQQVGNRNIIFDAHQGNWIDLPDDQWSHVVQVRGRANFGIRFQGKDEDVFSDDDLGTLTWTIRPPWRQRVLRHWNRYFLLEVELQLESAGRFGRHAPSAIFACRNAPGSANCTTVSGGSFRLRAEVHPVRPVPPAGLPPRPVMPAGTPAAWPPAAPGGTNVTPASPINVIPNPVVIPRIPAATATPLTAARIQLTFYRPGNLNFTNNDRRLQWTAVSTGGGQVRFVGAPRGRSVLVYGVSDGAVRLDVSFAGVVLARYRALVDNVRRIPCRFNILNGPTRRTQPLVTPADVLNHLAITNCFLRPIGLALALDNNATRAHGARATGTPGIFRIRVPAGRTRRIPSTGHARGTRMNYRQGVMNFAYIVSERSGALGAADDYPASNAGATITDAGTPSTSWISPTGVPPDAAASAVVMTLLAARQRNVARFPNLSCMYVTDGNWVRNAAGAVQQLQSQQMFAGTIAHELGHILNLGHRVDAAGSPFNDNLNYPPGENVMHWNNPTTIAQDFDYIQARAVRQSPLVPP